MAIESYTFRVTTEDELVEVASITADSKCNIYICNYGGVLDITIRLAISATSPGVADYIFYDFPIKSGGTFIITDVLIKSGDKVWINNSTPGLSVRVEGQGIV